MIEIFKINIECSNVGERIATKYNRALTTVAPWIETETVANIIKIPHTKIKLPFWLANEGLTVTLFAWKFVNQN